MAAFENMHRRQSYNIHNAEHQREVHEEISRARHSNFLIDHTDPDDS